MIHIVHVFAITLAAVALITQIVALATPNFATDITGAGFEKMGLFYWCDGGDCQRTPEDMVPEWGEAVQALAIVGLVALVFALIVGIVSIWSDRHYYTFNIVAAVIAFLAAFFIMVEFAVYAAEKKKDKFLGMDNIQIGYSYVFSVSAFLLALGAGVFFLLTLCCAHKY